MKSGYACAVLMMVMCSCGLSSDIDSGENSCMLQVKGKRQQSADVNIVKNQEAQGIEKDMDYGIRASSLDGCLLEVNQDIKGKSNDWKRNTAIVLLNKLGKGSIGALQGKNDGQLFDVCWDALKPGVSPLEECLYSTYERSEAQLKAMSGNDMRNSVVVMLNNEGMGSISDLQAANNGQLFSLCLSIDRTTTTTTSTTTTTVTYIYSRTNDGICIRPNANWDEAWEQNSVGKLFKAQPENCWELWSDPENEDDWNNMMTECQNYCNSDAECTGYAVSWAWFETRCHVYSTSICPKSTKKPWPLKKLLRGLGAEIDPTIPDMPFHGYHTEKYSGCMMKVL